MSDLSDEEPFSADSSDNTFHVVCVINFKTVRTMSDLSDEEPFSADSSDNTGIQCSKSTNILILDSFVIQKSSAIPNLDKAVPVYDGKLPLQSLKYENAMRLAKKHVPENNNWYYQQLISERLPKNEETEVLDDDINQ
ncbi:hypothetical protein QE152_g9653 [Popillia japonica]|uniref:Uncharacterized protein n=1 Tax=Popillia japonica TaxID=7064 RepID=A0AAW1LXG5_POPJA